MARELICVAFRVISRPTPWTPCARAGANYRIPAALMRPLAGMWPNLIYIDVCREGGGCSMVVPSLMPSGPPCARRMRIRPIVRNHRYLRAPLAWQRWWEMRNRCDGSFGFLAPQRRRMSRWRKKVAYPLRRGVARNRGWPAGRQWNNYRVNLNRRGGSRTLSNRKRGGAIAVSRVTVSATCFDLVGDVIVVQRLPPSLEFGRASPSFSVSSILSAGCKCLRRGNSLLA